MHKSLCDVCAKYSITIMVGHWNGQCVSKTVCNLSLYTRLRLVGTYVCA